jgi:hypothetical protein
MINASPETVRAITQVFKLAGILDDRCSQPDKARIAAWAEQVERHKLTENDLLDGLQAYYDLPSERAMQIGDLIQHSRKVRRDRNEREAEVERNRRAELLSVKASDEVRSLTAGVVLGPVKKRTKRLAEAERALQCVTNKREAIAAISEYFEAKTAKEAS